MKQRIFRNSNGMTLLSLVIVIAIMITLISITLYESVIAFKKNSESKIEKEEIEKVQNAVLKTYYEKTSKKEELPGMQLSNMYILNQVIEQIKTETKTTIKLKDTEPTNYYLLKDEELKEIGITETEDEYIVNYKTGEVINKTKLKTQNNEPLYIYKVNN